MVVVIVIPAVVFPLYHLNAAFDSMYVVVLLDHESTTLDSGRLPHGQRIFGCYVNITFKSFTTVT